MFQKPIFVNNIVSSKDLLDLSVVFMQNAFEIVRHHSLMLHAHKTFMLCCSLWVKFPLSAMLAAVQADRGWLLSSLYLPIAAVEFVQQLWA